MPDYFISQGDSASPLTDTLKDSAGDAVNIQGATVRLTVRPAVGGNPIVNGVVATNDQVGDGTDGTKGHVSYPWQAGQTDTPGEYLAFWVVTFSGGAIQTYPNDGYILLRITADAPVSTSTRFASSADLADRLGIELTAAEHVRANALLAIASGLIQRETGQAILEATETVTRPGSWSSRLRLAERPATVVTSAKIDGVLVAVDDWYLDGDELVRLGGWGGPDSDVEVVYTHGWAAAEIPAPVKATCLEVVVRVWVNPGNARQEGYGLEQVSYASSNGLLLTEEERRTVNDAIRRSQGSVTLR